MASNTKRLDMKHGFMKSIIRNQVDRDNYDKEVRARQTEKQGRGRRGRGQRKPDLQVYTPRVKQNQAERELFALEYEDQDGQVHTYSVFKDEGAEEVARQVGEDCGLRPAFVQALTGRLQEEIEKRLPSTGS